MTGSMNVRKIGLTLTHMHKKEERTDSSLEYISYSHACKHTHTNSVCLLCNSVINTDFPEDELLRNTQQLSEKLIQDVF